MTRCVSIEDQLKITLVDNQPGISLPQLCPDFEPAPCPSVVVTVTQWDNGEQTIQVDFTTDILSRTWARWRDTDEFGVNPGAWSEWLPEDDNDPPPWLYDHFIHISDLQAYHWYDLQFLIEPSGLDGWQEISPLCGGWWHLQLPMEDFPPVDPPVMVPNPDP